MLQGVIFEIDRSNNPLIIASATLNCVRPAIL